MLVKTNLTYSSLLMTKFLSLPSKTKKHLFISFVCFECVTGAKIKKHWQCPDLPQPTFVHYCNLIRRPTVLAAKYHHMSINGNRTRSVRDCVVFKYKLVNIPEFPLKQNYKVSSQLFVKTHQKRSI